MLVVMVVKMANSVDVIDKIFNHEERIRALEIEMDHLKEDTAELKKWLRSVDKRIDKIDKNLSYLTGKLDEYFSNINRHHYFKRPPNNSNGSGNSNGNDTITITIKMKNLGKKYGGWIAFLGTALAYFLHTIIGV